MRKDLIRSPLSPALSPVPGEREPPPALGRGKLGPYPEPGRGGACLRPLPPLPGRGAGSRERGPGGEGFDALAAIYDAAFTKTPLGRHLRSAVHRRLDAAFRPGDRVLEIGCGTGEDAVHLARRGVSVIATDASGSMVEVARWKAAASGLAGRIEALLLAAEALPGPLAGPFDGAFSNFGALNCVADLPAVAHGLAGLLRPHGRLLLCVMGPLAPWEWARGLALGRSEVAFRRLRRGGVPWRGLVVRYPSPRRLARVFAPAFRPRRLAAVGALLPPTELAGWAARHPRLLVGLAAVERRLERVPPLPWLADHYLLELERRP